MTRIALCLGLLLCLEAHAYSGKELLEDCRAAEAAEAARLEKPAPDGQAPPAAARCLAYVSGFADGYATGDFLAGKIGVQLNAICLPRGEDAPYRLARAVVAHLERQPPDANATVRNLVAGALAKTFPCAE